jgi:hypothetical protein
MNLVPEDHARIQSNLKFMNVNDIFSDRQSWNQKQHFAATRWRPQVRTRTPSSPRATSDIANA